MPPLTVSEIAEKYLNQWAEALMTGEIQLWELPSSVAQFYFMGSNDQIFLGDRENAELERQVNRLHLLAFTTDKQRGEQLLDRLDDGLVQASAEQWEQLQHDLRIMQKLGLDEAPTGGAGAEKHNAQLPTNYRTAF